jgi:hypothetical protein
LVIGRQGFIRIFIDFIIGKTHRFAHPFPVRQVQHPLSFLVGNHVKPSGPSVLDFHIAKQKLLKRQRSNIA